MVNKAKRSRKKPLMKNFPTKPASASSPLWTKPVAWIGGLILGALGVALTSQLVPRITDAINEVSETGDPVIVQVNESALPYPIALPSSIGLSDSVLAELSQLPVGDQRARLYSLGGVRQGEIPITVTVMGNRADEVRITNIMPIVDCSVRDAGTLVWTDGGFGATQDSTVMHLSLDESLPAPYFLNETLEKVPFFPAKTVALKQDEQVVIVIHAAVIKATCSFELEMTVMDGDETRLQLITNHGEPFLRAPYIEREKFQHVYYGGNLCKNYVELREYPAGSC